MHEVGGGQVIGCAEAAGREGVLLRVGLASAAKSFALLAGT